MTAVDVDRLPPAVRAQLALQAPQATTGDRVHLLLARLDGVRPAGDGKWYARCPAHEDKSPSLSIRDARERILLHCFAGCDSGDVLTAVGLDWSALYQDRDECAYRRPNEGSTRYARRTLAALDPLDLDRTVLAIAAEAIERGETLSLEDQARVELAIERLEATR